MQVNTTMRESPMRKREHSPKIQENTVKSQALESRKSTRKRVQIKGEEKMETRESQTRESRRAEVTNAGFEDRVLAGTRGERRREYELRVALI